MSQWLDATTSVWKTSLSRYTTNRIQYTCSSVAVARNAWRSTYDVSLRRWPSKSQSSGPKEVGWQALPYWLPPQVGQGLVLEIATARLLDAGLPGVYE